MVANPERRKQVRDAALRLLGREGSRAVTHRAVDLEAGLPQGTTSNYFSSRAALFLGMCERLFVALRPEEDRLAQLADMSATDAGPEYVGYIVERLLARPDLGRAWFELRLEAMRSPEMAGLVGSVLRKGFAADVDFYVVRGLPGGEDAVKTLHHLVDGIVFDTLTIPLQPRSDPVETAKVATRALLSA